MLKVRAAVRHWPSALKLKLKKKKEKKKHRELKATPNQLWSSNLSKMWFPHCPPHLSHHYRLPLLVTFSVNSVHPHKIYMCAFQSRHLRRAEAASVLQARQSLSIYLMTKCLLMHASEVGRVPGCNMKQNGEHPLLLKVLKGHVNPPAGAFPMLLTFLCNFS